MDNKLGSSAYHRTCLYRDPHTFTHTFARSWQLHLILNLALT